MRGLDPGIIKHSIPLEEGAKPVRKRKRLVNPNLDAVIRKGLDKMLEANVIFPVRYSKWVANLVPVQKKNGVHYGWEGVDRAQVFLPELVNSGIRSYRRRTNIWAIETILLIIFIDRHLLADYA